MLWCGRLKIGHTKSIFMVIGFMQLVQDLLNIIMWNRRILLIPRNINSTINEIVIFNPTIEDKNIASIIKEKVVSDSRALGVPSEEEILSDARTNGFWTEEDEIVIKEAESHIAFLQSEKAKQKFLIKKKKLDQQILDAKEKLTSVSERRQQLLTLTAEYMGNEAFLSTLAQRTVRDINYKPLLTSDKDIVYFKINYPEFTSFIFKEIITEGLLPQSDIRRIARSIEWRMLWTLGRENISALFSQKVCDLSMNQRMLIYWSRVYDLAYEDVNNRPDDTVIENDESFDEWLLNRNDEHDRKSINKMEKNNAHEKCVVLDGYYIETCTCGVVNIKAKGHGERPRHDSTCPYGTYRRYTNEEKEQIANQIYSRNSKKIREVINREQDIVADVGIIDEKDLRNKKSRTILGSKQEIHQIRK